MLVLVIHIKRLVISIFSCLFFIGINELFFFFNMSQITFNNILNDNMITNYFLIVIVFITTLFLLSFLLSKIKLPVNKFTYVLIISNLIFFITISLIYVFSDEYYEIQSIFSFYFSVIFTSYLFFYSIFALDVVK